MEIECCGIRATHYLCSLNLEWYRLNCFLHMYKRIERDASRIAELNGTGHRTTAQPGRLV